MQVLMSGDFQISPLQTRTLGANVNVHELEPFGGFGGTLGDGGYDPSTSPQKLPSRSPQSHTTTQARSGSAGITAGDMGTQSVLPYSTPHYYNVSPLLLRCSAKLSTSFTNISRELKMSIPHSQPLRPDLLLRP